MIAWRQIVRVIRRPSMLVLWMQIAGFVVSTPVLARLKPPRLAFLLGRRRSGGEPDPAHIEEIIACVAAVLRPGAPLVRPTCITRGLILYHFLRRAWLEVVLCFGAGYPQGEVAAHCWLQRDGRPFMEPQDPRQWFTEVPRMSPE